LQFNPWETWHFTFVIPFETWRFAIVIPVGTWHTAIVIPMEPRVLTSFHLSQKSDFVLDSHQRARFHLYTASTGCHSAVPRSQNYLGFGVECALGFCGVVGGRSCSLSSNWEETFYTWGLRVSLPLGSLACWEGVSLS
jgi:hypothetical protein